MTSAKKKEEQGFLKRNWLLKKRLRLRCGKDEREKPQKNSMKPRRSYKKQHRNNELCLYPYRKSPAFQPRKTMGGDRSPCRYRTNPCPRPCLRP